MVRIINGYQENKEALDKHNALVELAKRTFRGDISAVPYKANTPIIVREGITGCDVEIYSHFVDVNKKSYFKSAKKFAEEAEKIIGIEFILQTNYKL